MHTQHTHTHIHNIYIYMYIHSYIRYRCLFIVAFGGSKLLPAEFPAWISCTVDDQLIFNSQSVHSKRGKSNSRIVPHRNGIETRGKPIIPSNHLRPIFSLRGYFRLAGKEWDNFVVNRIQPIKLGHIVSYSTSLLLETSATYLVLGLLVAHIYVQKTQLPCCQHLFRIRWAAFAGSDRSETYLDQVSKRWTASHAPFG